MGVNGEDIQLSTFARLRFPFSVECKSRATIAMYDWYKQGMLNAPEGTIPVLVIKENKAHPGPLAVLSFDDFMKLVEKMNDVDPIERTEIEDSSNP